jgi:periplasmic protein TonB
MAAVSARGMVWHGGNRHALEYAIAASLALHALALLFLPALPSMATRPVRAQPPLEARLAPEQPVEPPKPPPPPLPEVETKPQPRQALRPAPPKPRPARKPVIKRPQPAGEPVRAPIVAPPPPQPPAPVAPPVSAAPAAAAVTAPPPVPRAPVPDTASLVERYRAAIIEQAKRYKRYPRFARDNGWEGKAVVRMAIAPDGAIAALRVTRGTGFQILDDQAREMVRSAKQDAVIPDGLRGRSYSVDIPVVFNLRDADR